MTTSAERILRKLNQSKHLTISGEHNSRMEHSIEALNTIDPSFSDTAERLLNSGDSIIEKVLVSWVDSNHRINNALSAAEDIRNLSGLDYNAATFVLESAILQSSLVRLDLSEWWELVRYGHKCLLAETASPHPTLLSDSTDEVDRYCYPLAVASTIMKVLRDDKRFIKDAPEFIAWVGAQADMHDVLSVALRISSTNPTTIREFMQLQKETTIPLHSGLL